MMPVPAIGIIFLSENCPGEHATETYTAVISVPFASLPNEVIIAR